MDAMDSGYESKDKPIYMVMSEDIFDDSYYYPNINMREASYKIYYFIRQVQM